MKMYKKSLKSSGLLTYEKVQYYTCRDKLCKTHKTMRNNSQNKEEIMTLGRQWDFRLQIWDEAFEPNFCRPLKRLDMEGFWMGTAASSSACTIPWEWREAA